MKARQMPHVFVMLIVVILGSVTAADAHVYKVVTLDDGSQARRWYFKGSTYDDKRARAEDRKDPINLIFYKGGGAIDNNRVNDHLREWDPKCCGERPVGGRGWRVNNEIFRVCKDNQYAVWPFYPGQDEDKSDQHGSTARKRLACANQHHGRLWDDLEHSRGTSHTRGQWSIMGLHHEKVVLKKVCRDSFPYTCTFKGLGHKPDRDWDRVRLEATKAMHIHCSQRRWRYHLGAARWYQNYRNSGYIARISMRHGSSGCGGA